jgi:hypothetical protein
MTPVTRRSVLGGSALAAISLSGRDGGTRPLNPPSVPDATTLCLGGGPLRISVSGLWPDHPVLQKYRTAITKMQALPTSDPRNWTKIAQVHYDYCSHGNWYIWPWHRAYLVSFERICGQLSGYSNFRLPYWDWTANRQMPATFMEPTYNGAPNPLFDATRTVSRTASLPDDPFGQTVMNQIISESNFEMFMSFRPTGQKQHRFQLAEEGWSAESARVQASQLCPSLGWWRHGGLHVAARPDLLAPSCQSRPDLVLLESAGSRQHH